MVRRCPCTSLRGHTSTWQVFQHGRAYAFKTQICFALEIASLLLRCATFPQADYAEERLDAHDEFKEELDEALRIRKMVDTGLHDLALDRLMASTEVGDYVCRENKDRSDRS